MRDMRAQQIVEISVSNSQVLRFADTHERVDKVYVIAPSHEDAERRVQEAYQRGEPYYRVACSDDDKPTRIYFIVASNDFQARFVGLQLYRRVPRVQIADPKPLIPMEV